jgi:DnaJ-class molecular chaperone
MNDQTAFTFKGEGHQQQGHPFSNLYIDFLTVSPSPSSADYSFTSRYSRVKNDLFYKHKITLQEAISCQPVKIPFLDGRMVILSMD